MGPYFLPSVSCCFILKSGFVLYSCSVFVLVTEVTGLCLCVVLCHTYVLRTSLQQSVQFCAIHQSVFCAQCTCLQQSRTGGWLMLANAVVP